MEEIELNNDESRDTICDLDGNPKISWFCNKNGLLLKTYGWLVKNAIGIILLIHGLKSHTRLTFMRINIQMTNNDEGLIVDNNNYYIYKDSWIEKFNQNGYSVYALDLQGHGESEAWKNIRGSANSFDDLVDDVIQYMNHIQDEISNESQMDDESNDIVTTKKKRLPMYIIGHSMGGSIALRILQLLRKEKEDNINAGEENNYKKCNIMLDNSTNVNEIDNDMVEDMINDMCYMNAFNDNSVKHISDKRCITDSKNDEPGISSANTSDSATVHPKLGRSRSKKVSSSNNSKGSTSRSKKVSTNSNSNDTIIDSSNDSTNDGSNDITNDDSNDSTNDDSNDSTNDGSNDSTNDGSNDTIIDSSNDSINDGSNDSINDGSNDNINDSSNDSTENNSNDSTQNDSNDSTQNNSNDSTSNNSNDNTKNNGKVKRYYHLDKLNIRGCVSLSGMLGLRMIGQPGSFIFNHIYLPITKILSYLAPYAKTVAEFPYKTSKFIENVFKYDKYRSNDGITFKYLHELAKTMRKLFDNVKDSPKDVPVLLVHSKDDGICYYKGSESYYNKVDAKGSELYIVDGLNHSTTLESGNEDVLKKVID
ncbi:hypothetical protein [Plasmodium yoelii yoelii]|nr:hypothetical protein [Plasmodium yoelii yoelii]